MKLDETKLQEVVEKIAYQQFGAEQIDDLYAKMGILNDYVQEQLRQTAFSGSVSFPKGRPKCCGREMYCAGGTLGKIDKDSVRYWRCDVCKQEVTDLAS